MESYNSASENTSSLKYERTQNRDIMNTIERINRSVKYTTDTEALLNRMAETICSNLRKDFKQQWRNHHETHENPPPFAMEVVIGSPISRKYKPIDDSDEPFDYMTMDVSVGYTVSSDVSDPQKLASENTKYGLWFAKMFSTNLAKRIAETVKEAVNGSPFADKFHFSTLEPKVVEAAVDNGDVNKIGTAKPEPKRINIRETTTIRLKNFNGESFCDCCPAIENDLIHDGLVSNISIAFARLDESR